MALDIERMVAMNLILTMAGRYSRFLNEGYRIPKYLLPWGNNSILSEIINNLNKDKIFSNIFLIANNRDEIFLPHVRDIMRAHKIPVDNLIVISDTAGQAHTAKIAIEKIIQLFQVSDGAVCFHNIDTILYNRNLIKYPVILEDADGIIDIFESGNHNYSYVMEEEGVVHQIAEKVLISSKATSGLYAFKNMEVFLNHYSTKTTYISEIYQKMISQNLRIQVSELYSENDTIVLGTPSEYLSSSYILDL
jgi:UDP-N-acetylglucosamine diphosphorylase / glucose-1-phosphate thymidylyltransferase / UDP-N-acetylgalactosamine diphosphorylase / glucosamine-1-phosphate N-acetyltransferase / galactosamine-1-phosphate N-acetyltransferase